MLVIVHGKRRVGRWAPSRQRLNIGSLTEKPGPHFNNTPPLWPPAAFSNGQNGETLRLVRTFQNEYKYSTSKGVEELFAAPFSGFHFRERLLWLNNPVLTARGVSDQEKTQAPPTSRTLQTTSGRRVSDK